ncbi:MAG: hypothetical protein AUI83_05300, partial [Armatimonadetes bacterium 13_1_40CM_3_65_7]
MWLDALRVRATMRPLTFREAERDDFDAMGRLWRTAFNAPQRSIDTIAERIRPHRILVATDGDRLVATAQGFPLRQWFGGRPVPTVGIASVATDPLYRGTGAGSDIMERILIRSRDEGHALATLYPATVRFYRQLGFELGGTYTRYRVAIPALPAGPAVELADVPDDGGPIAASYARLAERESGLMEGVDDDWWPWRVLGRWSTDAHGAVMTGEEIPDGYTAWSQESLPNKWGYRISCTHLVAHTRDAALALLAFFRRFKGVGREVVWQGPPVEPFVTLLPEDSTTTLSNFRSMSRILDVPAAFESRGYPD